MSSELVKAVVLAGDTGTTKNPLANSYPSLLLPMAGAQPLLYYLLGFLKSNGIREVAISLCSQLERIQEVVDLIDDFSDPDLEVRWCVDRGNRGAGGVLKDLLWFIGSSPILVMDSRVCPDDLDLASVWSEHKKLGSAATMLLQSLPDDSRSLENVSLGLDGELRQVSSLHRSRNARRQLYPTGIYLFAPRAVEVIDSDGYVDLKEQFLQQLAEEGNPVRGYVVEKPIGRIETAIEYLRINERLLMTQLELDTGEDQRYANSVVGLRVGENVRIADTARIIGPVTIGDNCEIQDGAAIIGPTIICGNTTIGHNSIVRQSIIWPYCQIGDDASIEHSLVTENCTVATGEHIRLSIIDQGAMSGNGIDIASASDLSWIVMDRNGRPKGPAQQQARRTLYFLAKRAMDLAAPLIVLPMLLPLFVLIGIAIKLDSRGPIIYSQPRFGKGGRKFNMHKFRTMHQNADKMQAELREKSDVDGPMFKLLRDPRITRVGSFLRRTSLDELPQLWNVLRGEMSLVGPRPLVMEEMTWCPRWRDIRLTVKPGLTGLWQVSGRSTLGLDGWVEYDISYVRNYSMKVDLTIIWRTFKVFFSRRGAV